jgi:hypothetical protein
MKGILTKNEFRQLGKTYARSRSTPSLRQLAPNPPMRSPMPITPQKSASVYKSSPARRKPAFATIGRIRPEISQGAVRISDDLKTGPEIRWKTLIEEVQLRRPESINFAGMLGELGIEHGHQVFGGVIL